MILEFSEDLNKLYCYFSDKENTLKCYKMIVPSSKKIEKLNNTTIVSGVPYILPKLTYKSEDKEILLKCIHNNPYKYKYIKRMPRENFIELIDSYTCHIPIKPTLFTNFKESTIFLADFYFLVHKNALPVCCKKEKIFFNEAITNLNYQSLIFNYLSNYFIFKDFIVVKKEENFLIKYFHKTYFCDENLQMCEGIKVGFKNTDMIVRNGECINEYFLRLIYEFVKSKSIGVIVDNFEIAILYDDNHFIEDDKLLALPEKIR
ncbi:hypothetical protein TUBRATIS_19040 [Tubulinosema ratisbonensis]|uniref:Uncharacterized protein n=1 Tax=Tubulinosema ratisbonensis TaxID=291195 RepID=A0A437AKB1_9MICR|nr:hypothetical protein TUBRATIS_19040 [Tubulinosema ratisbonensis]